MDDEAVVEDVPASEGILNDPALDPAIQSYALTRFWPLLLFLIPIGALAFFAYKLIYSLKDKEKKKEDKRKMKQQRKEKDTKVKKK